MRIAVPTRGTVVDDHFGHCEFYTVFTIEDKTVVDSEQLPSPVGCGCKSNIASVLKEKGVSVMLAGNIGQGAVNVLNQSEIKVISGCSGDVKELAEKWLAGKVMDQNIICDHHDCGNH